MKLLQMYYSLSYGFRTTQCICSLLGVIEWRFPLMTAPPFKAVHPILAEAVDHVILLYYIWSNIAHLRPLWLSRPATEGAGQWLTFCACLNLKRDNDDDRRSFMDVLSNGCAVNRRPYIIKLRCAAASATVVDVTAAAA